jgi:TolA-binding protein
MISSVARAQEPEPSERRAQLVAEELERDAMSKHGEAGKAHAAGEPGGDPDGFAKCAAGFLELYETRSESYVYPFLLLWNAAACSDGAGEFEQAMQARTLLLERYPESALAQDTLFYLAKSHEVVGQYEEAATRYEQFAERHGKDARTVDALQNAYLFRIGLDQREQAGRDLAEYEQLYEKKDVAKAASIFWTRQSLLDSRKAKREHAEDYLQTYGKTGGVDRAMVAEAVIAQDDWRRSCRKTLLHDSCITVERVRMHPSEAALAQTGLAVEPKPQAEPGAKQPRYRPPKRCGSADRAITTVHDRSSKLRDQAQSRFKMILKTVGKGSKLEIPEDDLARIEDFVNAWAMAMIYIADAGFEDYLRLAPPTDLDFFLPARPERDDTAAWTEYRAQLQTREESIRRLYEFLARKAKRGQELQDEYAAVKGTGSPHGTLAAAARTAMILQSFADQLRTFPVPRNLRSEPEVQAFCEATADVAVPIAEQAIQAWTYCVERSTLYQYFNEFSRLCEAELSQLDPVHYPETHELFGESVYVGSGIASAGVLSEAQANQLGLPVE